MTQPKTICKSERNFLTHEIKELLIKRTKGKYGLSLYFHFKNNIKKLFAYKETIKKYSAQNGGKAYYRCVRR